MTITTKITNGRKRRATDADSPPIFELQFGRNCLKTERQAVEYSRDTAGR